MKRKRGRVDLTSVAGVPLALGFILLGLLLEGGSVRSILQLTAAFIVFGGTLGAILVSYSIQDVRRAASSLHEVFVDAEPPMDETINALARFAIKARKDGIRMR